MKVIKVFVLFSSFAYLNAQHISIQIDENDFGQVADFLQTFTHGPIRPYEHSFILRNVKKFTRVLIQMGGFMLTLVASNLLTVKFTPAISAPTLQPETKFEISFANNSTIDNDRFQNEFGCHKNVCWRSCFTENETEIEFWCYTSPELKSREYKSCTYHSDCAPYWECLNLCHGKTIFSL